MLRRILIVGLASLVLVPSLAAAAKHRPVQARAARIGGYAIAWQHWGAWIERAHNGRYYAHWECDVGGTVLGAGIYWIWLTPPSAVAGALAGAAFTVGCHVGAPDVGGYMSGVPYMMHTTCWMVYPRGSWRRRFEECLA